MSSINVSREKIFFNIEMSAVLIFVKMNFIVETMRLLFLKCFSCTKDLTISMHFTLLVMSQAREFKTKKMSEKS